MSKTLLLFVLLVIVALILAFMAVRSYRKERTYGAAQPRRQPPRPPRAY